MAKDTLISLARRSALRWLGSKWQCLIGDSVSIVLFAALHTLVFYAGTGATGAALLMICWSIVGLILWRIGVYAMIMALWTWYLFRTTPLTVDTSAWFVSRTWVMLALVLALSIWALRRMAAARLAECSS